MLAAAAANVNAQFVRTRIQAVLERAAAGRGDDGGMPVHAHHRSEGLEPERIAEAREQLRWTVVMQNALGDRSTQPAHSYREPGRHSAAVQREVGMSRALH